MMRAAVIGAGSFGTAMARHIATKGDAEVALFCRGEDQARAIDITSRNTKYLPDVELPKNVTAVGGRAKLGAAIDGANMIVMAVPAQAIRATLADIAACVGSGRGLRVLNLAKGIEISTGKFMREVAAEALPGAEYTTLSGPSHAEEVALGMPTAVVAASASHEAAVAWQSALSDERLRVYTSDDTVGVELGGSMKNVIAIAVGIARAAGFGDNSAAALVTRGLAEITRCGARLGASPMTLAGLAGIGDLMVTCFSRLSRNFRFGELIGRGLSTQDALNEIGQVVEGMHTVRALVELARGLGVDLPISEGVYSVLFGGVPLDRAVAALLSREPKREAQH